MHTVIVSAVASLVLAASDRTCGNAKFPVVGLHAALDAALHVTPV